MNSETLLKELKIKNLSIFLDQCFHYFPDDGVKVFDMTIGNIAAHLGKPLIEVMAALEKQIELQQNADVHTQEVLKVRKDVIWVDTRQRWEWEQGSLLGSYWLWEIPLKSRLLEWQQQHKKVVMISNYGHRSFAAAMGWRAEGFLNVQSLYGGVSQDPWCAELKPGSF